MAADLENDGEAGGLGASLESFKEVEEVAGIIQDLENTIKDQQKHEVAVERFRLVLDWYQEQPHLLDPHLERLLELLVLQIRREEATAPLLHATATLAAHIFKVRGPKVVVKYLPHEVADLERVIAVLQVGVNTCSQVVCSNLKFPIIGAGSCGLEVLGDPLHTSPMALHYCHDPF